MQSLRLLSKMQQATARTDSLLPTSTPAPFSRESFVSARGARSCAMPSAQHIAAIVPVRQLFRLFNAEGMAPPTTASSGADGLLADLIKRVLKLCSANCIGLECPQQQLRESAFGLYLEVGYLAVGAVHLSCRRNGFRYMAF